MLPELGQGASRGCVWCHSAPKRGYCGARRSEILSCGCWVTSSLVVSEELWKGLCNPGRNRGCRGHGSQFPFLQTSRSLAQLETRHVLRLAKREELSTGYVYFFGAQRCRNWEGFRQLKCRGWRQLLKAAASPFAGAQHRAEMLLLRFAPRGERRQSSGCEDGKH